jgi:general secretion pathway protein N
MTMLGKIDMLDRVMIGAALAGLVAGALAFVPSPFAVAELFETAPVLQVNAPPALRVQPVPEVETFDVVSQRPLFNPERVPDPVPAAPAAGPGAAAPSALGDLSEYRLVGIAGDNQTQRALIRKSGGPAATYKPGDILDGWTIERIGADGVSISGGGRKETLTIPRAKNASAPP